jgi:hypothetical protein
VARLLVRAVLTLIAGLISLSAHANITCNNASGAGQVLTAGTISVPQNAAVGSTISTFAPITYTMQCAFTNSGSLDTSATNTANFATTAALASGTDVYATGISGLGVRYTFNSTACNAANVVMTNDAAAVTCSFTGPLGGAYTPAAITVTAQLVVTGTIKAGASTLTTALTVTINFKSSDSGNNWG